MPHHAESERRRLLITLAEWRLFAGMEASALSALADELEPVNLPGGAMLFEQGDEADALYLLLHGRMAAVRREDDGRRRTLGTVTPGECVGETGLIAGETHAVRFARVVALRDCELLRLSKDGFERLVASYPHAMLGMARLALRRFYGTRNRPELAHCIAVLPGMGGVDVAGFARRLAMAFEGREGVELIDAELAAGKPAAWFSERESAVRNLIYVGNENGEWRDRCVRQCDAVLLLVDASRQPAHCSLVPTPSSSQDLPQHLVLLQRSEPRAGGNRAWRGAFPHAVAHHHVRHDADIARLLRRLTGRARGLVLSGGGARGFAHLGVICALREAGLVFDYVGGSSIGAIVGAGFAADWSDEQMLETYREHFVSSDPLGDWTLPLVSLRSGARVSRRLRAAFGERDIEDLPLPFFCVSSNLTAGALEVHERGPLWCWLRASSSIPGVLPPVFSAGRVLVDGGVIDNLPVGEMRSRLAGEIVAVDVGGTYRLETRMEETELPPWWKLIGELFGAPRRPGLKQILLRAGMVNSEATSQRRRRQTRLLIKPMLDGIELLDWRSFDRAVELGYEHARKQLSAGEDLRF
jgi:NTE family protein